MMSRLKKLLRREHGAIGIQGVKFMYDCNGARKIRYTYVTKRRTTGEFYRIRTERRIDNDED